MKKTILNPKGGNRMKVLFLDIDGVLNTASFLRAHGDFCLAIDPEKFQLIKEIVESTGAFIVLTSSWREHWEKEEEKCDASGLEINRIFHRHGLSIFDKTEFLGTSREEEIEAWLSLHPEVKSFVAIDDMVLDSEVLRGHFVKTSFYLYGLTVEGALDAIRILNERG